MNVSLDFRLYMMRYGMARIAAGVADPRSPQPDEQLRRKVVRILTEKVPVPERGLDEFKRYLSGKPPSPRYSPIRKQLKQGKVPNVERQDLWLASPDCRSSVGALSENYYNDPVTLAHILGLVRKQGNLRTSRGKLCSHTPESGENPFVLPRRSELALGLWLLREDGDYLWAILHVLNENKKGHIGTDNRVAIFLESCDVLLENSRELRTGSQQYREVTSRLRELKKITQRNQKEGLNIGQPWSWFLVPRLELYVDAGFLSKDSPEGLSGYRLTDTGSSLAEKAWDSTGGAELLDVFMESHYDVGECTDITWEAVREAIGKYKAKFASPMGYLPLYETASAVAIERKNGCGCTWEVPSIIKVIKEAAQGSGNIALAVDRQGSVESFKLQD